MHPDYRDPLQRSKYELEAEREAEAADTRRDIQKADAVIAQSNRECPQPYFEDGFYHVCAWCNPGWKPPDGAPVTHGICERHAREMRDQLTKLRQNRTDWFALAKEILKP